MGSVFVMKTDGVVTVGCKDAPDRKTVLLADNLASNGVIHVIDGVLIPPAMSLEADLPNVAELVGSCPNLTTLSAAVLAGDIAECLGSAEKGPWTLFAPNNDAFGTLPSGTVDTLLKPENKDQLVSILKYHVLNANVKSTDLAAEQTVTTVEGHSVFVMKTDGVVTVGCKD